MAARSKGFGDIWKGLKKNPALLITIIVGVIIVFVLISNRQSDTSGGTDNTQGLPNGTGGSNYYVMGLGDEYSTGGPWDSFFRKHPASYHNRHHHVTGKSHHDHHNKHSDHHDKHKKKKK